MDSVLVFKHTKGEQKFLRELRLPRGMSKAEDFATLLASKFGSHHFIILFDVDGEQKRLCELKIKKKEGSVEHLFFSRDDMTRLNLFLKKNKGQFKSGTTDAHNSPAGMGKREEDLNL